MVERRGVIAAESHRDQVVVLVACGVGRSDAVSGQGAGLVCHTRWCPVVAAHTDRGPALGEGAGCELRIREPGAVAILACDHGGPNQRHRATDDEKTKRTLEHGSFMAAPKSSVPDIERLIVRAATRRQNPGMPGT